MAIARSRWAGVPVEETSGQAELQVRVVRGLRGQGFVKPQGLGVGLAGRLHLSQVAIDLSDLVIDRGELSPQGGILRAFLEELLIEPEG